MPAEKEVENVKLSTTHHFVLLAFKPSELISSKAMIFLKELGRLLTLATDHPIETVYSCSSACLSIAAL